MNPYQLAPSVAALPIPERTDAFRRTCLKLLAQEAFTVQQILAETQGMLANEQYELVQGVELAVREFEQNPQLGLAL